MVIPLPGPRIPSLCLGRQLGRQLGRVAGSLLLLAVLSAPVAAAGQQLRYLVWLGGSAVMDLSIGLESDTTSYGVTLQGQLVGPPSWFFDIRIAGTASGTLHDGQPQPARYRLELSDDGKMEWLQLDVDASGLPVVSADPPMRDEGRQPLDEAARRGMLDPLSAIQALLLQATAKAGGCPDGVAVYDGRRRFDVTVRDEGEATLRVSTYNLYHGPARRCEVTLKPVGGFRTSGRDLKAFPTHMTLFLAPLAEGGPPVLVRVETETDLGKLLLHLIEASGS